LLVWFSDLFLKNVNININIKGGSSNYKTVRNGIISYVGLGLFAIPEIFNPFNY